MAETIYKIDGSRETDGVDKISKTKRKQQMLELQDLGEELVALSKDALKKTPMSDELREAIKEYQRIPTHGAHRRQMQYIGKIMRDVDVEPLSEALDALKGVSAAANARQHHLEKLRAQLMENEAAFGDLAREFPTADIQHLRQLRRNALREAEQGRPPRAYRELFRELRELGGNAPPGDAEA